MNTATSKHEFLCIILLKRSFASTFLLRTDFFSKNRFGFRRKLMNYDRGDQAISLNPNRYPLLLHQRNIVVLKQKEKLTYRCFLYQNFVSSGCEQGNKSMVSLKW